MTLAVDIRRSFRARGSARFDIEAEFEIASGLTLALLGPSGSGKTLLLETMAGLHPHQGAVSLDGADITHLRPEQRGFGFVFQDYALFPHLRVRDNVAFGIRYRQTATNIDRLLRRFGITHLADRYPPSLSGGEQQRIALARALAVQPHVLLLDEPLSSLDLPTREALRADLTEVLAGMTSVYVTHDRDEAHMLADQVAVIRDGRIVQMDSPAAVFARPADAFVARFTGSNCVPAAQLPAGVNGFDGTPDDQYFVIRPEDIRLQRIGSSRITARVRRVVADGAGFRVSLSLGDAMVDALTHEAPALDADVGLAWPDEQARFLPGKSGAARHEDIGSPART